MLEQVFKFSSLQYAEGEIGLQADSLLLVAGMLLMLLVGFVLVYFVTAIYTSDRSKALSLGLRIPALLLLCLPLFEPVLITPGIVPDENFVAVLVDNSASMNLPDGALGETRSDDVRQLLLDENEGIVSGLEEDFKIRYYAFGSEPERVADLQQTRFDEKATNLTSALDRVLSDFKGLPLTGIVLLTDGADNSSAIPLNKAEELRSLGIPLHIVGLGQETAAQDREILDAMVSKGIEETTGAEIDVKVRSWASEPEPVTFNILAGGETVFSEKRSLKGDGKLDQFTLFFDPGEAGAREYTLQVEQATGETNTVNNAVNVLIDTRKDTLRVLYLEGYLRRDFKFIKRALENDQVVDFTSIARTGTGKYYRQGIKQESDLTGGFAADEEELYKYKAVILGDIEASAFSLEQLEMIEKAVRIRGSGFLMLGGRTTLEAGAYENTPVSDLLPVEIDLSRRTAFPPQFADPEKSPAEQGFRFAPTGDGFKNPILKLSPDPIENESRWREMPGLTSLNYLGAVKPGATVLAEKPADEAGEREPLLVVQRYGKGRTATLATASTWRWQMLMEAGDTRHQRFWRQLVRWLAASAPNRVNIDLDDQRIAPGDEMPLTVRVYDETFNPENAAAVRGFMKDPLGVIRELDFQRELTEDGVFTASFSPPDEGLYELEVVAEGAGGEIGAHARNYLVRPSNREYYDATLKRDFLQHLAEASNGFYYSPDQARTIPAGLRERRTSTSIFRAAYLWDMPFLFGLILLLLSAEWIYRRRKGLP